MDARAIFVKAIYSKFENLKNFEKVFTEEALNVFGSGWVWVGFEIFFYYFLFN